MSTLQIPVRERPLDVTALRRAVQGSITLPGDPDWDTARLAWNLAADQRPAMVAVPANVADVQAIVRYAAAHDLRVAPQSTGHAATTLELEDAILVKLAGMRRVTVDPVARVARAEAGAWWDDVTTAAGAHGLVALAGSSPDVGIGGYATGGGVSWLGRRYGLCCNNVRAYEIVLADGRHVRADADHEPDLYWALRGGGGNFGVVTHMELQLFPITEVYAGVLFFPWERSREVLHAWAEWTRTVPDTVTSVGRIMQFPPFPELPDHLRGKQFALVEACILGDEATGDDLITPLRALGADMDTFGVMPATRLAELHMDPPAPVPGVSETRLMSTFPAEAVDALVDVAGHESGSVLLSVEVRHIGGALATSSPDHGALDRFDGDYLMFAVAVPVPELVPTIEANLAAVDLALAEWDAGQAYSNFYEKASDASYFFPPESWDRLQAVRAAYDPEDRFRSNHPIALRDDAPGGGTS